MALKSFPLSNADTAWYNMEDPTNLMMVTGIVFFKSKLNFDDFQRVMEDRLLRYRRFRMKVVPNKRLMQNPDWVEDKNFDINAHLQHIALPEPGNQEMLEQFASKVLSTPLDFSKSPWHAYLVDNVDGRSAMVMRLHHCIADGIALVRVMLEMTEESPEASLEPLPPPDDRKPKGGALQIAFRQMGKSLESGRRMAEKAMEGSLQALSSPEHAIDLVLNTTELALKSTTATGKLLLMPPDPQTAFKGPLKVFKKVAWTNELALSDIKRIGKVTDCKVNDVLMGVVTGALRRYLEEIGSDVSGLNVRAAVPVNLRPLDGPIKLGNEFGLVFLSLPLGEADPLDRLLEVRRRMNEIKGSPEAVIAFGILGILGVSPKQFSDEFVKIMGAKATLVATNVPGPRDVRYFCGSAIDNIMFWVPQSGKLGMGVSIFSYAGKVIMGVATDSSLVPEPRRILDGMYAEYEALLALADQVEA